MFRWIARRRAAYAVLAALTLAVVGAANWRAVEPPSGFWGVPTIVVGTLAVTTTRRPGPVHELPPTGQPWERAAGPDPRLPPRVTVVVPAGARPRRAPVIAWLTPWERFVRRLRRVASRPA